MDVEKDWKWNQINVIFVVIATIEIALSIPSTMFQHCMNVDIKSDIDVI